MHQVFGHPEGRQAEFSERQSVLRPAILKEGKHQSETGFIRDNQTKKHNVLWS